MPVVTFGVSLLGFNAARLAAVAAALLVPLAAHQSLPFEWASLIL